MLFDVGDSHDDVGKLAGAGAREIVDQTVLTLPSACIRGGPASISILSFAGNFGRQSRQ